MATEEMTLNVKLTFSQEIDNVLKSYDPEWEKRIKIAAYHELAIILSDATMSGSKLSSPVEPFSA